MREMVGGCCVCSDDRGWSENPLVYCDGQSCTVAVHQACYGIVTVPTGPWYCRKCESQERAVKVKCELCPSKYGALKRTDNSGWAHVVCALYIPEVRFENVTTMEPIQLQLIPTERFNKVCYICKEKGKVSSATVGACMQCNKPGCRMQFHVTCAQSLGLLCEEAGNYLDNVKYCGYCQHHYSKLRKGGNVKPIPPYKPVSSENQLSDSNSEKESESIAAGVPATPNPPKPPQLPALPTVPASSKQKTSSGSSKGSSKTSSSSTKTTSTSSSSSNPISSSSHQKTVHNSSIVSIANSSASTGTSSTSSASKTGDKLKAPTSSARNTSGSVKSVEDNSTPSAETHTESNKIDKVEVDAVKSESKGSKKRKTNSRTPTPVALAADNSVSVLTLTASAPEHLPVATGAEKKGVPEIADKPKKVKVETTQSILTNQPVVALTSISTIKNISATLSSSTTTPTETANIVKTPSPSLPPQQTIIQSTQPAPSLHAVNSLVVSVPLINTALSPHHHPPILSNQTSVVQATPLVLHSLGAGGSSSSSKLKTSDRFTPSLPLATMTGGSSNQGNTIISSEMSGGGLKITYEKQDAVTTEVDMELEVLPTQDVITKRSHSSEKSGRGKKRNSGPNGMKRARVQNASPQQLQHAPPGAFSSISQSQIKDSPPSSPSSESQGATTSRGRNKGRKSAPAAMSRNDSPKETKDIKLFQNGVTAPHMLGNQLNPNSNMAQKMSDHLNSELEAHSIFNPSDSSSLVGPQLHHRVIASTRASSTGGSSTASGGSGLSSMLSGNGGNIPQTLDQLLERQWEQGSQFLMEQAQHFDIASLLSCLHQLRAENLRLEEHVSSLLQRRDHLLAVNARLAIPLTGQPATPQSSHPHTLNNIHPNVGASHGDVPRSSRHIAAHPQGSQHSGQVVGVIENGIPTDSGLAYPPPHTHRSPALNQSQPSPSIRHSPAGSSGYPSSSLLRQNADTSGRSAPRPQPYPLYQGQGPSSQQQMVIRRDSDVHHPPPSSSSKPS